MPPTPLARAALALSLALPCVPAVLGAQSHRHPPQPWERRSRSGISIGGDAVYTSVGADGPSAIGDGVGYDAHASLDVSALSIGGGYQRTAHEMAGASRSAIYDGFYVEPRVRLELGATNFTPYVAGRLGRTRQSLPTGTTSNVHRTGTALGAGGGVLVALTRGAAVDLGVLWSTLSFSEDKSVPNVVETGREGYVARVGLRLTP